jgi:cytochrome c-type biogenesis protein CcmH/NrfG
VALSKAVNDDEARWVALSNNALPDLLRSDNPEIQKYLSEAYESLRMGAPHSAATSIEAALKIDPKLVNAWLMLGNARMTNNSFEPAFVAFRKAIELGPVRSSRLQLVGHSL